MLLYFRNADGPLCGYDQGEGYYSVAEATGTGHEASVLRLQMAHVTTLTRVPPPRSVV